MATRKNNGRGKVRKVMIEFKQGELTTRGRKVTNPKQALAIALNEAREAGENIPDRRPASKKAAAKKGGAKKAAAKRPAAKKATKKAGSKKSAGKAPAKKTASKRTGRKTSAKGTKR